MNFDEILHQWDRRTGAKPDRSRERLNRWIDAYPPDANRHDEVEETRGSEYRAQMRNLAPQKTLDLHGFRVNEAKKRTMSFIDRAISEHLRKVLIIHGKGKHSRPGTAASGGLRQAVYEVLRSHPLVGEIGVPDRRLGGSGAVWAILRNRPKTRRNADS